MIRRRWIVAQDAVRTAGRERDQSRGVLLEIVEAEPALAFRRPQLAGREQAAEIAVPAAVLHEKIHAAAGDRHVGTDERAHADGAGGGECARRAVHAVAVADRDRVVAERGGAMHEILGQRRALEEAEGTATSQLDVRRDRVSHTCRRRATAACGRRGKCDRGRRP